VPAVTRAGVVETVFDQHGYHLVRALAAVPAPVLISDVDLCRPCSV
jgi:hypothetical protein